LRRSIRAGDELSGTSEHLKGLIQVSARIRAGDSGGPLVDATGAVVGMDTAAADGPRHAGFAIPIDRALGIAQRIRAGRGSADIHIGPAAFLGVEVLSRGLLPLPAGGAFVSEVVPASPAASAGLTPGDAITAVGGQGVATPSGLQRRLDAHHPGDAVPVTWLDALGLPHTATVVLGSGPPA
jgi:S1-C subfamily serine protease